VAIFHSLSQADFARRLQADYRTKLRLTANIFHPGSVQLWNWNKKDFIILHFLCGETELDNGGLFYLTTGEGPTERLCIEAVVELFVRDMKMQHVFVVLDGLPQSDYASRVVASIAASLEHACARSSEGLRAVKQLVIAVASGGHVADAMYEALTRSNTVRNEMRQLLATIGGRDVFIRRRTVDEMRQVQFAARLLKAARRASAREDAAEITFVFHQGGYDLYTARHGRALPATVISGSWQSDTTYGQEAMLPALMHDLCRRDTAVYEEMRTILMGMVCSDGLPSSIARILATQCAHVCLDEQQEPGSGDHLVAVLAMLMLLDDGLVWLLPLWQSAAALSEQLQELRRNGCDLRSRSYDPLLLMTASAGASTAAAAGAAAKGQASSACDEVSS
jgi:hypothetical protein